MKNKVFCFLICLLLIPCVLVHGLNTPELPRVVDDGDLLTEWEEQQLTDSIREITDKYEMDVVILTVDSLGYKSAQEFADDFYDDNGYGAGSDYSGVLLLISMEERDWWISTCGDGIYAITDYGIETLFSRMSGYLSSNMFYEAFDAYLDALPAYFEAFESGEPIDGYAGSYDGPGSYTPGTAEDTVYYEGTRISFLGRFLISLIIGLLAALITVLVMRGAMNTKRAQHSAGAYLKQGSYELKVQRDLFLYSNVTKTARPKESSSSGGGSSVHRSSGGRSHGGGGGKF